MRSIRNPSGFTLIELLVVVAIIGVIAAIAGPGLLRARLASNETAAIATVRTIHGAELNYSSSCGGGYYSLSFPALALGPGGTPPGFLPPDLTAAAVPQKSGYTYALAAGLGGAAGPADCNGSAATDATYYLTAVPLSVGFTGDRGFAGNGSGSIWQDVTGIAPTEPFMIGGAVSPVQ